MFFGARKVPLGHSTKCILHGQLIKYIRRVCSHKDVTVYYGDLIILINIGKRIFFFKYRQVAKPGHSLMTTFGPGHIGTDLQYGITLYHMLDAVPGTITGHAGHTDIIQCTGLSHIHLIDHASHTRSLVKLNLFCLTRTRLSVSNTTSTIPSHNIQSAGIAPF